jgi:hypothetical protein
LTQLMETAKGRLIGHGFYFDQLKVGDRFYTMGRTVTETDLVTFINLSWLNEEGFVSVVPETPHTIEGRFIPGCLIYIMAEGLLAPTMQFTGQAFLHTELDHKNPVSVGDTIHVEVEVTESRPTSKGNRGLVRSFNRVLNQHGETVLEYTPLRMMKGSPGRQPAG